MNVLHLPGLEMLILIPLLGALTVKRISTPDRAQKFCVAVTVLTLVWALGVWVDFSWLGTFEAHDRWDLVAQIVGDEVLVIDQLSAPLLPLTALLYLMTAIATLRTKFRRYSFAGLLASEAVLLATLSCKNPWGIIALLAVGTVFPYLELRAGRMPTRVYTLHMTLFVVLLVAGGILLEVQGPGSIVALVLLMGAILIRCGIVPAHCWMADLFEQVSFGTALLFVTPMVGVYAAMRLVLPIAPEWALQGIALASLFTAVYAAGLALVQRDARRFFCYLFISHSALVLVGLEIATPKGLTGALSLWLSASLAMAGFGLTLRSLEARMGRLSLAKYHGLYQHTPTLAAFFLLTGLASVGFPGTFGFVGMELLLDGAVGVYPLVGMAVVLAAALNGIAMVQAYFRLFGGPGHVASISLRCRTPERIAVLTLAALILGGGLFPQPGLSSRHRAAMEVIEAREKLATTVSAAEQLAQAQTTDDEHSTSTLSAER